MCNRFVIGGVAILMASVFGPTATQAALTVGGGASLYTNSLQGASMDGEIGGTHGPGGPSSVSSISASSTQFDYGKVIRYVGGNIQNQTEDDTTSSITATLSSAANVGTIIAVINYPGPSTTAFSNGPDFAFSVNGSPVASGTWALSDSSSVHGGIQISTLATPQSASTVKMSMTNVPYYNSDPSNHYADYRYLIALPNLVAPLTTLGATSSTPGSPSFLPGNTIKYATDPFNALSTSFYSPDDPGFLQISLGGTQTLAGVLLATYPGTGGSDLTIKDDLGNVIGTLTGTPNDTLLLPIKFSSPVTTSYLRFESVSGTGVIALNEVIPLVAVQAPEPASFGLLSAGLVAALLRRRTR